MPFDASKFLPGPQPPTPPADQDPEAQRKFHDAQAEFIRQRNHTLMARKQDEWLRKNGRRRVVDATGRVFWLLGEDSGEAPVAVFPWQVVVAGGFVTIAYGSHIWAEEVEQTAYITNYHTEQGNTRGYAHAVEADRWVCFELHLDAESDIQSLSIYLRDASKGFYEVEGGILTTQYLPIAYIDGNGRVASQFLGHDPILTRQNVNGYYGWWYA